MCDEPSPTRRERVWTFGGADNRSFMEERTVMHKNTTQCVLTEPIPRHALRMLFGGNWEVVGEAASE